jgi:hypothetical protein
VESSNDQQHADGNDECCDNDVCRDAIGSLSDVTCINGSCTSHSVAQVVIHSHVASWRTGIQKTDNVHDADMVT